MLPATAHRRLAEWQSAGMWERLHRELLRALNAQRAIDWSASVVDGSHSRALLGAPHRSLTGRPARAGSKHHCEDVWGIPLAISLTGGQRNDVTQLLPLIDTFGPIAGKPGRPRKHAERVLTDRGYDHDKYRPELHMAFMLLGCAVVCQRKLSAA